jgi:hypothetical protein
LVKSAAEEQKYRQSLSPEDKQQILSKNTDAHREQRESLPRKKKVKVLETDAAAHNKQCKSLSPDDLGWEVRFLVPISAAPIGS